MRSALQMAFAGIMLCLVATALPGPSSAAGDGIQFSLTDHHGKRFSLQDQRGRIVLIFFGYTLCPDVCPIELQHMATALRGLGQDADRVRGLFITVDPEHDTPEVLARYVGYFGNSLVGLTGTSQQIETVAQKFRVSYQKSLRAGNQYTMDHTANLYVVDQHGELDTIVPFGFPAAHIESLLREMLAANG
ncbi:MAG: SCO family protein [Gammaproteobacteria bacterium]|nr:SCO family protein [Gammaproteobacteria bacterium]